MNSSDDGHDGVKGFADRHTSLLWMLVVLAGIAAFCGTFYLTFRKPEPARYEYHAVQRGSIQGLYRTDKTTGQVQRVD